MTDSTIKKLSFPDRFLTLRLHRTGNGRRPDPQGDGGHPVGIRTRGVDDIGPGTWRTDQGRASIQGVRVITGQAVQRISQSVALISRDHKVYYPGAKELRICLTGDRSTGRLLGVQLVGHRVSEVSKRVDIIATALYHGTAV